MVERVTSFRDFEHQGWSSEDVALGYHDYLSPITTQAIGALLDAAGVRQGTRVVDIATGAGYAAAAAAERGAEVIGIDFSATQVALARQRYPSLEFREGDAGSLPFPDRTLTPWSAISACHMSLTRTPSSARHSGCFGGGRSPSASGHRQKSQSGLGIIYGAVQSHGRMDVPLPPGPSFFLFSDPGQCERSLHAAGFQAATVSKVPQVWRMASPDVPFEAIMKGTVRAAALLRAQTPEALAVICDAARRAASSYERGGAIELMMPAVVAAAEKP